jgi:tryptophan-rich sensory protein
MSKHNFFRLIIAVAVSELAGVVGSIFTFSAISSWYITLTRPTFSPPNWIFGPVWTTLYLLMGISAFLIWQRGLERKDVKLALSVFGFQLVLNAVWSIVFFGLHNPGAAFFEIIFLWLSIIGTMVVFYKIHRVAAYLLLPYILWVSFAGYLNYVIWTLN